MINTGKRGSGQDGEMLRICPVSSSILPVEHCKGSASPAIFQVSFWSVTLQPLGDVTASSGTGSPGKAEPSILELSSPSEELPCP